MRYLLDTHTAIWLFTDSKRLSDKARTILADRACYLSISIASVWELAIKISKGGKVPNINGVSTFLDKLDETGVDVLDITANEVKIVETLPYIHNDPFDRMIIATAKANELMLISADKNMQKYDVNWIE
jgi:PIN domain nuclease of toxin-antitoxin system